MPSLKSLAGSLLAAHERLTSPRLPPLSNVHNFVIPQYASALGNALTGIPLMAAIKQVLPDARIVALASGFSAELLQNHPAVDQLIVTPSPLKDPKGAVAALRNARPSVADPALTLLTTGNERSAIALALMRSGFSYRIGFATAPELTRKSVTFDPTVSQIDNNLRLLALLDHSEALHQAIAANPDLREPHVYPGPADFAKAHELLRTAGIDAARPIAIFITQTSPTQYKSWRPERFREVAEALHRDYDTQAVFVGTPAEAAGVETLRTSLTIPNASVAGKTGLMDLAALMSLSTIAITLDTGPMHVARSVGLPMVVIAPAWSPAIEWLPLQNPRARCLKNADLPTMQPGYIIDEVSTDEVLTNARELLALYPKH